MEHCSSMICSRGRRRCRCPTTPCPLRWLLACLSPVRVLYSLPVLFCVLTLLTYCTFFWHGCARISTYLPSACAAARLTIDLPLTRCGPSVYLCITLFVFISPAVFYGMQRAFCLRDGLGRRSAISCVTISTYKPADLGWLRFVMYFHIYHVSSFGQAAVSSAQHLPLPRLPTFYLSPFPSSTYPLPTLFCLPHL